MINFEVSINENKVKETAEFFLNNKKLLEEYIKKLPDIQMIEQLENEGFEKNDIVAYIVFISMNDWRLIGVRGGSESLWEEAKNEFVKGFSSFEDLSYRVISNLKGLRKEKKEQIVTTGKYLDKYSSFINFDNFIQNKTIIIKNIKNFVENIRDSSEIPIPVDKVTTLIARSLHFYTGYPPSEKVHIMYDVQIAKVSLKIGIIKIDIGNSDIIVLNLFNKKLRDTIIQAWDRVAEASSISAWLIDAFLWLVGRDYCSFDDKADYFNRTESCVEKRSNRVVSCPLRDVCRSFKTTEPPFIAVFSAKLSRLETVAVINC